MWRPRNSSRNSVSKAASLANQRSEDARQNATTSSAATRRAESGKRKGALPMMAHIAIPSMRLLLRRDRLPLAHHTTFPKNDHERDDRREPAHGQQVDRVRERNEHRERDNPRDMRSRHYAVDHLFVYGTAEQIDGRAAGQRQCMGCLQCLIRMSQHQVVSDGRGDNAGDENGVDVMEIRTDPSGIVRTGYRISCVFARRAEIEPPHGQCTKEGGKCRREDDGVPDAGVGQSRTCRDQRLAQCDDHKSLTAFGEMATLNRPVTGNGTPHTRKRKTEHRRDVFACNRDDPERGPHPVLGESSGDPEDRGNDEPSEHASIICRERMVRAQLPYDKSRASDLDRDIGQSEDQPASLERARNGRGHDEGSKHHGE